MSTLAPLTHSTGKDPGARGGSVRGLSGSSCESGESRATWLPAEDSDEQVLMGRTPSSCEPQDSSTHFHALSGGGGMGPGDSQLPEGTQARATGRTVRLASGRWGTTGKRGVSSGAYQRDGCHSA